MKIGIDLKQPSTIRGLVLLVTGLTVIGAVFTGNGAYIEQIIGGGITITGALGAAIKD